MAEESAKVETAVPKVETAFVVEEFKQTTEIYRTLLTLLVQIFTVLVLANATLAGYAISTRTAGILLIGPLFPLVIILLTYASRSFVGPMIYTAISLEQRYGRPGEDWLATTFWSSYAEEYVAALRDILPLPDQAERYRRLNKLKGPLLGSGKGYIRTTLVLIAVGEVAAAIILWQSFGWRLF